MTESYDEEVVLLCTCKYCCNIFSSNSRPIILKCGHNICSICLNLNIVKLRCLDCGIFSVGEDNQLLPVNFVLYELIHKLTESNPCLSVENLTSQPTQIFYCNDCRCRYFSLDFHLKTYGQTHLVSVEAYNAANNCFVSDSNKQDLSNQVMDLAKEKFKEISRSINNHLENLINSFSKDIQLALQQISDGDSNLIFLNLTGIIESKMNYLLTQALNAQKYELDKEHFINYGKRSDRLADMSELVKDLVGLSHKTDFIANIPSDLVTIRQRFVNDIKPKLAKLSDSDEYLNDLLSDMSNYILNRVNVLHLNYDSIPFISPEVNGLRIIVPQFFKLVYIPYDHILNDDQSSSKLTTDAKIILTYDYLKQSSIVAAGLTSFYILPYNSNETYKVTYDPYLIDNASAKLSELSRRSTEASYVTAIYYKFKIFTFGVSKEGKSFAEIYLEVGNYWYELLINEEIKWSRPISIYVRYYILVIDKKDSVYQIVHTSSNNFQLEKMDIKYEFSALNEGSVSDDYCVLFSKFKSEDEMSYIIEFTLKVICLQSFDSWNIKIKSRSVIIRKSEKQTMLKSKSEATINSIRQRFLIYRGMGQDENKFIPISPIYERFNPKQLDYQSYLIDYNNEGAELEVFFEQ